MNALLRRITTMHSASVTSNFKDAIVNVIKAILDGVCLLEIYSSENAIGRKFVKFLRLF